MELYAGIVNGWKPLHDFFIKIFYKKMSLKNPQNLKKMLRKYPASNV